MGISSTVYPREKIKTPKLQSADDLPESSNTNMVPECLASTPDMKIDCNSNKIPFNSPDSKELKFTSTSNKYSSNLQLPCTITYDDANGCHLAILYMKMIMGATNGDTLSRFPVLSCVEYCILFSNSLKLSFTVSFCHNMKTDAHPTYKCAFIK